MIPYGTLAQGTPGSNRNTKRIAITMETTLFERLAQAACSRRVSVSQVIVEAVRRGFAS